MAGKIDVPFRNGNMLGYAYEGERGVEWRPNFEFQATLRYVDFERGRSAAHLLFSDEQGKGYQMFLTHFDAIMHDGGFEGNKVTGIWTFAKRGQNYGVRLLKRYSVLEKAGGTEC